MSIYNQENDIDARIDDFVEYYKSESERRKKLRSVQEPIAPRENTYVQEDIDDSIELLNIIQSSYINDSNIYDEQINNVAERIISILPFEQSFINYTYNRMFHDPYNMGFIDEKITRISNYLYAILELVRYVYLGNKIHDHHIQVIIERLSFYFVIEHDTLKNIQDILAELPCFFQYSSTLNKKIRDRIHYVASINIGKVFNRRTQTIMN